MNRHLATLILAAVLLAGCVVPAAPAQSEAPVLAAAVSPLATPTPAPQPFRLALVHSNDTWGYLFACG